MTLVGGAGMVLGLIGFNAIMQIANLLFAPTVANLDPHSDNSYLSAGVYIIFYGTLAYTLANSAFKAIDILPNFVMGWIGQRGESRVDDASAVQQQAQSYTQTLAYSSSRGGVKQPDSNPPTGGGTATGSSGPGNIAAENAWAQKADAIQANPGLTSAQKSAQVKALGAEPIQGLHAKQGHNNAGHVGGGTTGQTTSKSGLSGRDMPS